MAEPRDYESAETMWGLLLSRKKKKKKQTALDPSGDVDMRVHTETEAGLNKSSATKRPAHMAAIAQEKEARCCRFLVYRVCCMR